VVGVEVTGGTHGQVDGETERAFESLFRANYDDLVRFAIRRVGPDAATDVVADVFLVAWRRRDVVPAGQERLWLFGVAAKVVTNERRSQLRRTRLARRVAGERLAPAQETLDPSDAVSTGALVRSMLATLTPAEQETLRLTEWEQLDIGEAAQVAGCSRAAFRVRLHRARRHLVARLAELELEPPPDTADTLEQVMDTGLSNDRGVIA
jgi:RNA polymerase sigma factor (sigma-70 family)